MHKELVISIIIIIVIVIANIITQRFTDSTITTVTDKLQMVKEKIDAEESGENSTEHIKEQAKETQNKWNSARDKLAYYVEHDEIEKIETELVAMQAYIEQKEYAEAVASIEKAKYIIEHLQQKEKLTLINIF